MCLLFISSFYIHFSLYLDSLTLCILPTFLFICMTAGLKTYPRLGCGCLLSAIAPISLFTDRLTSDKPQQIDINELSCLTSVAVHQGLNQATHGAGHTRASIRVIYVQVHYNVHVLT